MHPYHASLILDPVCLRCQGSEGYDLPQEKYQQWKQIEMTYNPDEMRLR